MSLKVTDNMAVSINYKLSDNDGRVIIDTNETESLTYLHGAGNILPGLENALSGKTKGDQIDVNLPPAEAYGEINPDLFQTVNKSIFQGVDKVEVGMMFEAQSPDGVIQRIIVTEVNEDDVIVDANHPLAGLSLHFDITISDIRNATSEEIENGVIPQA